MNDTKDWNNDFFDNIRTILRDARQKAYASINFMMVEAYWKIGQRIVEEEQQLSLIHISEPTRPY